MPRSVASTLPSRRRTVVTVAITMASVVAGLVLLLLTVRRIGWHELQASISSVGWSFIPVLALSGFRFTARATAWWACAGRGGIGFALILSATIAGDALGNLTPLGLFASEPAKVFFVSRRTRTFDAVTSLAVENAFYIASVLGMLTGGALLFVDIADVPPAVGLGVRLAAGTLILASGVALWLIHRRTPLLSVLASRLPGRDRSIGVRELEERLFSVLAWPRSRLATVVLSEVIFHIAAVAEVWTVLRVLPGGERITILDAFILESAGRLIVIAFKFIPYRLGVDEAGSALVASAIGFDPATGVALAVVRRVRVLCWNAVGLALIAARRVGDSG